MKGMSAKRTYTHDELLAILEEKKGERTITEFAEEVGVSAPMLSNILCGHRRMDGPTSRVLKYLGMRKVVAFERV